MKKKLLHILPLDTLGGVERLYTFFIQASKDHFEHVTINDRKRLSTTIKSQVLAYSRYYSSKVWAGIGLPKWPVQLREKYLHAIIKHESPDLIIVWNKVDGINLRGDIATIPVVYYEHGGGRDNNHAEQVKQFLAKVDGIIACSQSALDILVNRWQLTPIDNMSVCYNPVLGIDNAVNMQRLKREADQPLVLGMACRMVANKGVPIALHAVALLREQGLNIHIQLAGVGPELTVYQQLAVDLGIDAEVKFLGLVEDMSRLYRAIDVCLCPSINEAFGLVAVEASMYGVPVVASGIGGLQEVIVEGKNGLLLKPSLNAAQYNKLLQVSAQSTSQDKHKSPAINELIALNPVDLAVALKSLYDDIDLYTRLSDSAATVVKERFLPETYVLTLTSLLKRFCR